MDITGISFQQSQIHRLEGASSKVLNIKSDVENADICLKMKRGYFKHIC